ncbi:SBBP repeat-containing protein, partial [Rhizobium leguminosarum]|uniref:SBBP repeat-containing protein n=1 Tax=Rhizobium leguminosarum TaxID=384 RepID=UPI003F9A1F4E
TFGGGTSRPIDIGIMKFSPNGSARLYATYIGGSGNDFPHSLFSDPQGNLVVMGRSYSANYPTTAPLVGSGGQCDIVVTKLNAAGSALIGSLRIGGSSNDGVNIVDNIIGGTNVPNSLLRNYGDESRSEVVLDAGGNI